MSVAASSRADGRPSYRGRSDAFLYLSWAVVAAILSARAFAAASLPLTGDEAYYWEWSRHPAAGYYDHPPMVAWIVRLFDRAGEPLFTRLGFLLCGAGAALALSAFASRAAKDARAGALAALLLTLTPLANVAFATASPDGPYLLAWCAALWLASVAMEENKTGAWLGLGAALGAGLLSRVLGVALLLGVASALFSTARTRLRERGPLLALLTLILTITPFLLWNARHQWQTFAFALSRHHVNDMPSALRVGELLALFALAWSPGIFGACLWSIGRVGRRVASSPYALSVWTAVPLLLLLLALSYRERVEVYWAYGPLASLVALVAVLATDLRLKDAAYAWIIAPAVLLTTALVWVALAPKSTYALAIHAGGNKLRHNGPFEMFAYAPLARDVAIEAKESRAWVLTDGYGLSSLIDYYGGVAPVVIGYDTQGRESRRWYDPSRAPANALFVDKEPLSSRPDIAGQLRAACARVVPDGVRNYLYGGVTARTFYITRCFGMKPGGLKMLAAGGPF